MLLFLQSALISDEKAAEFRHKVYRAITFTHVAEYLLIALGSLCIVVAVVLVIFSVSKKKRIEMCIQARENLLLYDDSFCFVVVIVLSFLLLLVMMILLLLSLFLLRFGFVCKLLFLRKFFVAVVVKTS